MEIVLCSAGRASIDETDFEVVERKGQGHPDTLADTIAERFSQLYSSYCLEEFGAVANHWVDKVMAIGGESANSFGESNMVAPIQVIVAGKVTDQVGSQQIPIAELAQEAAAKVFSASLPGFDRSTDMCVEMRTNSAVGAGRRSSWYRPSSAKELQRPAEARANDTVYCTGYAPLSSLEMLVMAVETTLNGSLFKSVHDNIGTDIKVMGTRLRQQVGLTLCVPTISRRTRHRAHYDETLSIVRETVFRIAQEIVPRCDVGLALNTRDDDETVYMTHFGSAIDTGDIGVVGRGNRLNGLISPSRELNVEAPCGKNPVYHAGKLYSVAAQRIASEIWRTSSRENYVTIVADNGDLIRRPKLVTVKLVGAQSDHLRPAIASVVEQQLDKLHGYINDFINGEIASC